MENISIKRFTLHKLGIKVRSHSKKEVKNCYLFNEKSTV